MEINLEQKLDFSNAGIDLTLPKISISNCLDFLETPFDKEGVAQKTYEKNFNNPDSKYYQMSVQQIIESWEAKGAESCSYGSLLDDYIGLILTGTENEIKLWKLDNSYEWDERLQGICKSFDDFYDILKRSGDVVFVDREKTVYHKYNGHLIKGRFDCLFYNKKKKKYILVDWKSSGTIDTVPDRWTKKMLGPMFKFPQLNHYRYTLQLHFYKKTLIEDGYLPEGTKPEDIEVLIVNLPGHIIESNNQYFCIYKEAFPYNPALMDNLFKFAIQKQELQKQIG